MGATHLRHIFDAALTQSKLTVAMHGEATRSLEFYHVRANLGQIVLWI